MRSRILVLGVVAAFLAACGSSGGTAAAEPLRGRVSVFAAASLSASFTAIGNSFQGANPGVTVKFDYAGTPTLVTKIEQGAAADVFASADNTDMDRLKSDGFTTGTPQVFAHNELEIVVAPGNPKGITGLADLAKPGLIYITEAPTVPAGKYALQALQMAGVPVTPKSLETDLKSVLPQIELGPADAGIANTTALPAPGAKPQPVAFPAA